MYLGVISSDSEFQLHSSSNDWERLPGKLLLTVPEWARRVSRVMECSKHACDVLREIVLRLQLQEHRIKHLGKSDKEVLSSMKRAVIVLVIFKTLYSVSVWNQTTTLPRGFFLLETYLSGTIFTLTSLHLELLHGTSLDTIEISLSPK